MQPNPQNVTSARSESAFLFNNDHARWLILRLSKDLQNVATRYAEPALLLNLPNPDGTYKRVESTAEYEAHYRSLEETAIKTLLEVLGWFNPPPEPPRIFPLKQRLARSVAAARDAWRK